VAGNLQSGLWSFAQRSAAMSLEQHYFERRDFRSQTRIPSAEYSNFLDSPTAPGFLPDWKA